MSSPRHHAWRIYCQPLTLVTATIAITQALVLGWRDGFPDFHIFYLSAYAWRIGLDPYQTAVGALASNALPPAALLLLTPLTRWSFPAAAGIWTALGLLSLIGTLVVIAQRLELEPVPLILIVLSLQAVGITIRQGQVSLFLVPLLTVAWLADRENRPVPAGLALGVLLALKPYYGLFLLYWVWRGAWRALGACLLAGVTCGAVGLVLGWPAYAGWLASLRLVRWHADILNASVPGLAARWFADRPWPLTTPTVPLLWSPSLELLTVVAGLALVLGVTAWGIRSDRNPDRFC